MSYKPTPNVGTMREFQDVDNYNKKSHPIQFFIKDTVPDWFSYKKFYIEQKVWEFKHKYLPWHNYSKIDTGLNPKHYYDCPELMIHVNFKLLERYVVKEDCFNTIVWYEDGCERAFIASELEDLWFWWSEVRVKRKAIVDSYYSRVSDHLIGEATENDSEVYKELHKIELFWHEEDEYNLCRLMKLRLWMWS